ncbi:beta-ketoacyl synthase chain length factor [Rhodoferax sp.]|uniref:beta-ketoacyl synthase chain length factor n=1 Tax=Rhodoferax sp. TaxID=50421 RepID=UPI0019F03939|nr:beta-ketoacyl synthase chain length factor [Rhodoferax sp.]MBE0474785.1 beta-ketoacyl synthase chain length factor [Rhodoferax sp.]
MEFRFVITSWAAFSPGLQHADDWQEWAHAPWQPTGDEAPEVREMPAMARRRLNQLGRMAVRVAYWCQADETGRPVIFASRYGDAVRSLELLNAMAQDGAVSPTGFGLSVHNAIGATYSIARGDRANYLSIAGGAASSAAGLVEAFGLLTDGAPNVTLVCYDAPLPGDYARFHDEPTAPYAWAWQIALPQGDEGSMTLRWPSTTAAIEHFPSLPFGLGLLRCSLMPGSSFRRQVGLQQWELTHHV